MLGKLKQRQRLLALAIVLLLSALLTAFASLYRIEYILQNTLYISFEEGRVYFLSLANFTQGESIQIDNASIEIESTSCTIYISIEASHGNYSHFEATNKSTTISLPSTSFIALVKSDRNCNATINFHAKVFKEPFKILSTVSLALFILGNSILIYLLTTPHLFAYSQQETT
ncbi:MAG: hypothetical protein QW320_00830 [Ignisphaera sp.]